MPAPEGVVFRAIDGDKVWATSISELDVPFIVLYELVQIRGNPASRPCLSHRVSTDVDEAPCRHWRAEGE